MNSPYLISLFAVASFTSVACTAAPPTWTTACQALSRGDDRFLETPATHTLLLETDKNSGRTLLGCAIESNNPDLIGKLVRLGADPNRPLEFDDTHVGVAVQARKLGSLKGLLQNGANPNAINPRAGSPEPFAALLAGSDAAIELLLEAGANVASRDSMGRTVLMASLDVRQFSVSLTLIRKGADICAKDNRGDTVWDHLYSARHNLDERGTREWNELSSMIKKVTCSTEAVRT